MVLGVRDRREQVKAAKLELAGIIDKDVGQADGAVHEAADLIDEGERFLRHSVSNAENSEANEELTLNRMCSTYQDVKQSQKSQLLVRDHLPPHVIGPQRPHVIRDNDEQLV